MLTLRRLKIGRYRDVAPGDLRFSDGLNLVLGAPGAGKTTLLDLVSKVLRTRLSDPKDPLAIEIEIGLENATLTGTIESSAERDAALVAPCGASAELGANLPPDQRPWPAFDLRLAEISVVAPDTNIVTRIWRDGGVLRVERDGPPVDPLLPIQLWAPSLLSLALDVGSVGGMRAGSGSSDTFFFDESLELFRAVAVGEGEHPARRSATISVHRDGASETVLACDAFPEDVVRNLVGDLSESERSIALCSSEWPLLADFVRLTGLAEAGAELDRNEPKARPEARKAGPAAFEVFGNLRFWFQRRGGDRFGADQLSYAEKRLLAFLYYIACNPSVVIADELPNGLPSAWLHECLAAIGERQTFLSAPNALLFEHVAFETAEQVRESVILCRREGERRVWRNISGEEAERLHRACQGGLGAIAEELREMGVG
jgi:energy-coupling factor transporter ATP-binding protein EcfA2